MSGKQWISLPWGIYYGWIIVGVALISMAFWFGIRSNFSVFYVAPKKALQKKV